MTHEEAHRRAKALVAQMTAEEKASQLLFNAPAIDRLGIPAYNWWNEALHGVARAGLATVFPQAIAMAASFDPALLHEVAGVVAEEGRAKYNLASREGDRDIYKGLTFWSPNINIFRDPRWGRGHETYGEDPFLTAEMGKSFVRGLQGDGAFLKAAACAKHFAVHSGPETLRHAFNAEVSEHDLHDTYLPAFEKVVKEANVESVMGAYNRVNGEPCCGSPRLIGDILRGEWGFAGHYVSDCGAIADFHENHHVTDSGPESAALALKSGCDLNCGGAYAYLLGALRDGLITETDLTTAAERLFATRIRLGLFEETDPFGDIPPEAVDTPESCALNRRMANESVVLLKNEGGFLPLSPEKLRAVAVIGPCAQSVSVLDGNYNGTAGEYVTVADGIRRALPDKRVYVTLGAHLYRDRTSGLAAADDRMAEALAYARMADVTVLCLGLDPSIEGEEGDASNEYAAGDKRDLCLPESQQRLLKAVLDVTDRVVIVVTAGSAIDLGIGNEAARAILHAWYPGARGGEAVADVLFGRVCPSGRLPVTFYHNDDPIPDFTDYRMEGRTYRYIRQKPLYPFGFGLSYTAFAYRDFLTERTAGGARVSVTVTNTGARRGREAVQIYAKAHDSRRVTPLYQLCGIASVELDAGESQTVTVSIDGYWLKIVDDNGDRVEPDGGITLYAGGHQPDARSRELCGTDCLERRL